MSIIEIDPLTTQNYPISDEPASLNPLDKLFTLSLAQFRHDLELGSREGLIRSSIQKLQKKGSLDLSNLGKTVGKVIKHAEKLAREKGEEVDEEDDEQADYKNLPKAWKRHALVSGFGAAAVYFSTIPSQTIVSLLFTLGFLKLSKSYMIGFPRMRRYCTIAAMVGGAVALQSIWKSVSLIPLAAGLGIDAFTFTAKAYMKGKLPKDEGPKESNRALLCLEGVISKGCNALGSCVDGTFSKISSCAECCFGCLKRLCCRTPST